MADVNVEDFWDQPESSGHNEGFGPDPSEVPHQAAPRYVQQPQQYEEQEPVYEEEQSPALSEVETRLYKAQIYDQYLKSPPFEANDPLTAEVAAEFAAFARFKMEKLLGISSAASFESDFTDLEVQILKAVAKKVAQQTGAKEPSRSEPPKPVRTAPPAPRLVPPPAAPRQPQQKPRLPAPTAQRPPQRPPQRPAPAAAARPQQRPQQRQNPAQEPVPKDGEIVTDGQKAWRVKWVQMNPNEFGEGVAKRLETMRPDTAMTLPNGLKVYKTAGEEIFKIIKMDKTPQATDPRALPFPTAHQMAIITASQAGEASTAHSQLALKVGNLLSE